MKMQLTNKRLGNRTRQKKAGKSSAGTGGLDNQSMQHRRHPVDGLGSGAPLSPQQRARFEPSMQMDLSRVKIHTNAAADRSARDVNARAFTSGENIAFAQGEYQPQTREGEFLLAHELAHVAQQSSGEVPPGLIQRREFGPLEDAAEMEDGDWAHADRLMKTERWSEANRYNLLAGRSAAYTQIDQRRDFYLWFYEEMAARGHEIRWPLAAHVVADGANEGANRLNDNARSIGQLFGINDPILRRSNELETLLRRGNQVIFDDVFPKLRSLYLSDQILTGSAAQAWDAQTLIEEQNLIQPFYEEMADADVGTMAALARQQGLAGSSVAKFIMSLTSMFTDSAGDLEAGPYNTGGDVPPFFSGVDIMQPENRFRYGMFLADYFAPVSGDVDSHRAGSLSRVDGINVPEAPEIYTNGEMLARIDCYQALHELSAEMTNSDTSVEDLREMTQQLSAEERWVVMNDPWYVAILYHRHGMSPNQAALLLQSQDISTCGNLFQVVGHIEGVGEATAEDNIIVWVEDEMLENVWYRIPDRVRVQAISNTAYAMFAPSPFKWVWKDALQCYPPPRQEPVPEPEPVEHSYSVYFDTGSATLYDDSHELSGMQVLNQVLNQLQQYGGDSAIESMQLSVVGHASPKWETARTSVGAFSNNLDLSIQRADYIRDYLYSRYGEFNGPSPLIVRAPVSASFMPLENTTPADQVGDMGLGSSMGLIQTLNLSNNEQRFRRVDIHLTAQLAN